MHVLCLAWGLPHQEVGEPVPAESPQKTQVLPGPSTPEMPAREREQPPWSSPQRPDCLHCPPPWGRGLAVRPAPAAPASRGWSLAPPLAAGLAVSQFTPEIPFPRRSRSADQTREAGTRRQRRRGRLHRACQAAHAAGEGRPADRPTGRWLCAELGAGVVGLRAGRVHSPPLFHSVLSVQKASALTPRRAGAPPPTRLQHPFSRPPVYK